MNNRIFPVIDPVATGSNILNLRLARGFSVRDLQEYFGFEEPQAIYKWQKGKSLPTVDNLYALSCLLEVPMENILVAKPNLVHTEQQAKACCSVFSSAGYFTLSGFLYFCIDVSQLSLTSGQIGDIV